MDDINKLTIGSRIKEERKKLRLTQVQFASVGGVQPTTQVNYEKGTRIPDAEYLKKIAIAGCDVLYILTGNKTSIPQTSISTVLVSTSKEELLILAGKRLREEREHSGESQQSVAEKFGLSTRTWGKYERGETAPDVVMLAMLSNMYGFDSNYIITGVRSTPANISMEEQRLIEHYRTMSEKYRENLQVVSSAFAQLSVDK